MHFDATEDQVMVQQMVRRFVTEQISPMAIDLAHHHEQIATVIKGMTELGLRGARADFDHEGSGMDALCETFIIEEIARGDLGLALMIAHHNLGTMLLSAMSHHTTSHFTAGSGWIGVSFVDDTILSDTITTTIDFVPAGTYLTHHILVSDAQAVLIDLSAQGVTVTPQTNALGLRATSPARITLHNAPASSLCPTDDANSAPLISQARARHHVHYAAAAVGLGQAAYDVAATYAYERKQFGRRLTDFQVTQFKLANMAMRQQCARHMCYLATSYVDQQEGLYHALNAHAFACKSTSFIADEGVQLHGGYGYTSEYPIERYYRDSIALQSLCGGVQRLQYQAGALFVEQGS